MRNKHEEEATLGREEELMAHDMEPQLEEEQDIDPIVDELSIQSGPPLIGGHLPFNAMGFFPLPDDRVMDISNFTFDQLKKSTLQERQRYFPNNPVHPISINTKKVRTSNTKRNPQAVIAANVAFPTSTQDNTKYVMSRNEQLQKDLTIIKQQVDHLVAENQKLSSTNINMTELRSAILEELKPVEDTMKHIYNEMILLHEVMVPHVEIQKISQEILKVLKVACTVVDLMQDSGINYLNILE